MAPMCADEAGEAAPPPPPGLSQMNNIDPNMTLRKAIQTNVKLPTVPLQHLKPNDTKDTIWYEIVLRDSIGFRRCLAHSQS